MPSGIAVADPYPAAPSMPPPEPLLEGEHVLCTVVPCVGPRVDAVVVALDSAYLAAAKTFTDSRSPRPSPTPEKQEQHITVDLTTAAPIDLDAEQDPEDDRDDDNSSGKILFREAEDGKPPTVSVDSPPKLTANKSKKRRGEVSLPSAIEAYAENGHIKPSAAPAPHPITNGRVYLHFSGRDRRLDRWVDAAELERASESAVAAAASGVVENTLVDNAVQAEFAVTDTGKKHAPKLTRSRRRQYEEINPVSEREVGNEAAALLERAREEKTKVRNISSIVLGEDHIHAWYYSPYPGNADKLYICRFCLKYVRTERCYVKHCTTCTWIGPPGRLVYNQPERGVSVYEVEGLTSSGYCQRLCLLGKLFLDHKTLYFDVSPFLFYVVTIGGVLAGFFSKEKPICQSDYNLACILTLPHHQRKGVGRFLISLSYELTRKEGKTGSPERPLSDLGQLSYRSYWAYTITQYLRSKEGVAGVSAKDVAQATGIRIIDVTSTLKSMNLVSIWKGETYAETSGKALDIAEKKTREPQLPLRVSLLRVDAVRRDVPGSARGLKSRRKRPRKEMEKVKPVGSKSINGLSAGNPPRMSRTQVSRMAQFIQGYTLDDLQAPLDSPRGLSSAEVQQLAHDLGMSRSSCRVQMLKMAEAKQDFRKNADGAVTVVESPKPNGLVYRPRRESSYSSPHQGFQSEGDDEVYVRADDAIYSTPVHGRYHDPVEDSFFPQRETTLVRHPVSTNLREEAVYSASCTHGADENGVSDILVQDKPQNGLFHSIPSEDVEPLELHSGERLPKRGRVSTRKHDEEVVVIQSPSPSG